MFQWSQAIKEKIELLAQPDVFTHFFYCAFPAYSGCARCLLGESSQNVYYGCFTGAVETKQAYYFILAYFKRKIFEYLVLSISHCQIVDLNYRIKILTA